MPSWNRLGSRVANVQVAQAARHIQVYLSRHRSTGCLVQAGINYVCPVCHQDLSGHASFGKDKETLSRLPSRFTLSACRWCPSDVSSAVSCQWINHAIDRLRPQPHDPSFPPVNQPTHPACLALSTVTTLNHTSPPDTAAC